MKDCDCKKTKISTTWPEENDYGDNMLKYESNTMIDMIKSDFKKNIYNVNSIFNRKFEQEEINLELGNIDIDYSYLEPEMGEDMEEPEMGEEDMEEPEMGEEEMREEDMEEPEMGEEMISKNIFLHENV